jgi:hypothetical protein
MIAKDKAAKYIKPRSRLIKIRNPSVFFFAKRVELILGLLKKNKKWAGNPPTFRCEPLRIRSL